MMTITAKTKKPRGEPIRLALEHGDAFSPRVSQPLARKPPTRVEEHSHPNSGSSNDFRLNEYRRPEVAVDANLSAVEPTAATFPARQAKATYHREIGLLDWFDWLDASSVRRLLVIASLVVGLSLAVIFGLDLIGGWFFWRASMLMEATYSLCGLVLVYLCWTTLPEVR